MMSSGVPWKATGINLLWIRFHSRVRTRGVFATIRLGETTGYGKNIY